MATMNPVDLYHDPALDDLIYSAAPTYRNGPTNTRYGQGERRSISEGYGKANGGLGPSLSTSSRGGPISYRGVGPNADPSLHRSFSQRAKGHPFAAEAFLDDDQAEGKTLQGTQPKVEPELVGGSAPAPTAAPMKETRVLQNPPTVDGQRQKPREQRIRSTSSTAPTSQKPDLGRANRAAVAQDARPVVSSPGGADHSRQQDDQRSKWAHDRSPLQKLEVKLTDISKEEKRARVQEAELRLLQDRKLGKAPQRSQRATVEPLPAAQGATAGAKSPREPNIPRSLQQDLGTIASVTSPQEQRKSGSKSQGQKRRISLGSSRDGRQTNSDRYTPSESELQAAQPQVARAVSLQQQKPRIRYHNEDRPATQREKNASHQAALEQLTGARPERARSTSKQATQPALAEETHLPAEKPVRRQTSPVPIDLGSISGPPIVKASPERTPNQKENKQPPPSRGAALGLQQPKALRSVDSPPASLTDVSKHRQRKSSVSFKEPFDRRRPVDEWKNAVTASLGLEDFRFDQPAPSGGTSENKELATAWWEKDSSRSRRASRSNATAVTAAAQTTLPIQNGPPIDDRTAQFSPRLYVKCGPLLRYAGMRRAKSEASQGSAERQFWRGSIMIVTQDSLCSYEEFPSLRLFSRPKKLLPPPPALVQGDQLAPEYIDPIAGLTKLGRTGKACYVRPVDHLVVEKDVSRIEDDNGIYESSPSPLDGANDKAATSAATNDRTMDQDGERLGRYKEVKAVRIYADPDRDVTFWRFNIEIELGDTQQHIGYRINKGVAMGFWVPGKGQSMNIMFHSCNGFSMSVKTDEFSGSDPLWRDVLNNHQTRPFHVMIGGGDQIYNDRVTIDTQWFGDWTKIKNPHHKHQAPFTNEMKEELEGFYLERYCMWFSQGLFALANSSVPMINIWDDHDIIDGFGSYPHEFMKSPVFSGLGNIAFKYYMLFQHQSIDSMTEKEEPSWILGHAPGPYITSRSRSLYLELGQSVAFLGIDCRTERTKNDVMSIDTLELILDRCRREMVEGRTKHLIVLLGVPIAYPRLVWLENVLTSRAMDPIKALGRAGILKTGFLNKFDGGVEILDDLDDHWTASHHKDERNVLIQELQDLAAEKSARITILSGDVHLAAVGQFYSNPKLKIPKDRDHRYMPNIVSSAIVNTPPPDIMADVINKRNKIHHLDKYTDENMIPMFTHDVDHKKRNNTHLLPRRNWCAIREYFPGETPPASPSLASSDSAEDLPTESYQNESWLLDEQQPKRRLSIGKADLNPRNLIRRLSSRKAPPTSYRNDNGKPQTLRSASFDGVPSSQTNNRGASSSEQTKASSLDHIADVKALRPSFHRRPTNLSEKAARKGLVPAIDADGNEIDVNDHINLEGGLDIVINCEVDRKDPAGITLPYRVLIPALWYDGSSDREKLDEAVKPSRRATVLSRFGLANRPSVRASNQKDADEWAEEDDGRDSFDEVDTDGKPQRAFSFFGSRRKREDKQPEYDRSVAQHPYQSNSIPDVPVQNKANIRSGQELSTFPSQNQAVATRSLGVPPTAKEQPYPPNRHDQAQSLQRDTSQALRSNRPASYVVDGSHAPNTQIPLPKPHEQFYSSQPYDADATYVEGQQRALQTRQNQQPQSTSASVPAAIPQRTRSKQERVLGIGDASDDYVKPGQTPLRGDGILGKNMPPSSFRANDDSGRPGSSSSERAMTQGYSGIEAYREPKSRRRWSISIRDKARNLFDSIEGMRRTDRDDLYSDDDEEEYWEGPKQDRHLDQQQQQAQHRDQQRQLEQYRQQQRQLQEQREREQAQQRLRQQQQQQQQPPPQGPSREGAFRQWGPMYSYDRGKVYTTSGGQENSRVRRY